MKGNAKCTGKSGVERLFELSKKDNIEKAIIIENNRVYTYGYDRYYDKKSR